MSGNVTVPVEEMLTIARFVGISGQQMMRLIGLLELCSVQLSVAQSVETVAVDIRVLRWLLGECEHPVSGQSFERPEGRRGNFWWRTELCAAMEAAPAQAKTGAGLPPESTGEFAQWIDTYKEGNEFNRGDMAAAFYAGQRYKQQTVGELLEQSARDTKHLEPPFQREYPQMLLKAAQTASPELPPEPEQYSHPLGFVVVRLSAYYELVAAASGLVAQLSVCMFDRDVYKRHCESATHKLAAAEQSAQVSKERAGELEAELKIVQEEYSEYRKQNGQFGAGA